MNSKEFSIVVYGEKGVGKSSFIDRVSDDIFQDQKPTISPTLSLIDFNTNYGHIEFFVWEIVGHGVLREEVEKNADAAIILIDEKQEYDEDSLKEICNHLEIPVVIVRNKCDLLKDEPLRENYFSISSKTGNNIQKPFLQLMNILLSKKDVKIENICEYKEMCEFIYEIGISDEE